MVPSFHIFQNVPYKRKKKLINKLKICGKNPLKMSLNIVEIVDFSDETENIFLAETSSGSDNSEVYEEQISRNKQYKTYQGSCKTFGHNSIR